LSIFPDKSLFVEADSDRLLKNKKAGKVGKNVKGGKKGKSKKEVDLPNSSDSSDEEMNEEVDFPNSSDSSDEEVNEQQCPIALFNGSYRYISACGKGLLATIACGEDDDDRVGGDICRYSERVVAQNTCPENGPLNDEEEEDPCTVGGIFKRSENINYNADTDSCELAYFDLSEDRCELYSKEGGLGMKAVINLFSREEMLLWFSSDSGETFYNEEEPRLAVVSSDVALYDTGRALSHDLTHVAIQSLTCEICRRNQIIGGRAYQSTTYSSGVVLGLLFFRDVASRAIDGNLNNYSRTRYQTNPWWKVVLNREENVELIRVYYRRALISWNDNAIIELRDGGGQLIFKENMGTAQTVNEVNLYGSYSVKEVKIRLEGSFFLPKPLLIAEVQLFGPIRTPEPSDDIL